MGIVKICFSKDGEQRRMMEGLLWVDKAINEVLRI